jgi:DNA-binding PadR family transcriptional regulator
MDDDLRLSDFEEILLLVVSRLGGDAHGLLIRQALKEIARRTATVGSIYSALDRLEAREMVLSRPGAPSAERGGRAQRYYRLEPAGQRALEEAEATRAKLRTRLRPGWEPAGEVDERGR